MKRLVFAIVVLLATASCATTREARQVQNERELSTLIENRTFDFVAVQRQNTFLQRAPRRAPHGSGLIFLPNGFYNFQIKHMGNIIYFPDDYTLESDGNGWRISFSFRYNECWDPVEVFGCEGQYRYVLTIDQDGKAELVKSSDYNGHKYKDIYTGYITGNQNR